MKVALTIIMTFSILNFIFGQSPFNYGQNEKVYFVSTDLRNKLDIKTIYTAEKNFLKNNHGMGVNWNVTALSFDTNNVTDYSGAISLNSTFNFNFDSLIICITEPEQGMTLIIGSLLIMVAAQWAIITGH